MPDRLRLFVAMLRDGASAGDLVTQGVVVAMPGALGVAYKYYAEAVIGVTRFAGAALRRAAGLADDVKAVEHVARETPAVPSPHLADEAHHAEPPGTRPAEPTGGGPVSTAKKKAVESFPNAIEMPLPPRFVGDMMANPTVRGLREQYGTGQELTIYLSNINRTNTDLGSTGEELQSIFVSKVLREIFPDAKILDRADFPGIDPPPGVKELKLTDTAEGGEALAATAKPGELEMGKVKSANPGPGAIAQTSVREALGIPAGTRVLSLNNSLNADARDILGLVDKLADTPADMIIVSTSSDYNLGKVALRLRRAPDPRFHVVKLSQLDGSPLPALPDGQKYLVLNDTRGRMPWVYSAADVNVTAGAVNLSEPLQAGTPTVFFDSSSYYMYGHHPAEFDVLANQALSTGGATAVSTREAMNVEVTRLLSSPRRTEIVNPYLAGEADATPLAVFLRHLRESLAL